MGLHNQIVIGILKSAITNSRVEQRDSKAKAEDTKQCSTVTEYQFNDSDYTTNLYTYIISFCAKNIEFHQEREDLQNLFYRMTNWAKAHPFESKPCPVPTYPRSCGSFLNTHYAINPNSLSCSELISLPPHLALPSFQNPIQMIPSNELSKVYVEESLQYYSSMVNREAPPVPSNLVHLLPFLLYITYHCHSSDDLLKHSSIPCICLVAFLYCRYHQCSLINQFFKRFFSCGIDL